MMHRIITRIASLLLVAGLLAAPAAADAKRHHKRRARHHLVKHHRAVTKSAGRSEGSTSTEPPKSEPAPQEPSGDEPGAGETPSEPGPAPTPPAEQPADAGVVASYGEGVLNVELNTGSHVIGNVISGGTQFSCRSASTHETVTEGCNPSLLHEGLKVHEFSVNYGPNGAWFQRIIIVLP